MTLLLWVTGVSAVALFVGIAWYLEPLEPGVLALQFAATPAAFGKVIHAWSAADLQRYRAHLPFDCVLLAAYGTFGYLLATVTDLHAALSSALQRLARGWLPLAGAFDAAENAFHAWLTDEPRFGVPVIYALSAGCSMLKWSLLVGAGLLVAAAAARHRD